MRCGVLFICLWMWFGPVFGQSCYNIFKPNEPKVKLLLKSSQLNRLLNHKKISLQEEAWLQVIQKISRFKPHEEQNFSVDTKKLSLEGSALFIGDTMHLKISFLSTVLSEKLNQIAYIKRFKKQNLNINKSRLLALDEVNMNLKAPLREVIGFIQSLSENIKQAHPHITKIELTADGIHNERLYNKLKKMHFEQDVPYLKRIIQSYYILGNMALYSFLAFGSPDLGWHGAAIVSVSNAALFWIPASTKFKKFKQAGASLKLTIPLVESDNSGQNFKK